MGLWNSLRTAVLGVDLEAEQRRSDMLDQQIAVQNQIDYGPGGSIYNQIAAERGVEAANDTYEEVTQRQVESHIDVEAEVQDAFNEGLEEGVQNVKGAIAAPFKLTWAILPWQVWAALALYVFFVWMGGAKFLKGFFTR